MYVFTYVYLCNTDLVLGRVCVSIPVVYGNGRQIIVTYVCPNFVAGGRQRF